jgi:hypothetical protein
VRLRDSCTGDAGTDIETHIRRLERTRARINLALESFRIIRQQGVGRNSAANYVGDAAANPGKQTENPLHWDGSSKSAGEEYSPLVHSAYCHSPQKDVKVKEEEESFVSLPVSFEATVKVKWMRSSRVVRAFDCQCRSCNCPGFDPSIFRRSGI